jgi:hypothetical protein
MGQNCKLCDSPTFGGSEFCELHYKARLSLDEGYKIWLKAYSGELTMQDYLEEILKIQETGRAVKEIAAHLLRPQSRGGDDEGNIDNL